MATERTRLLVDAGLSYRETQARLASIGVDIKSIDAILITHEHCDHVAGLPVIARRLNKPVYMTQLTAPSIDWGGTPDKPRPLPPIETFQAGTSFTVGDITVDSFTIPHDARDPVGFCLRAEGVKCAVATDLGYITESVRVHLRGSALLVLESNHDLEMLKVGPYPWSVKQRVMSRVGHLSNSHACDFIRDDFDSSAAVLVLGHLSEQNNHPEIVRIMAAQAMEARAHTGRLVVAEQKHPTEVFAF